MIHSTHRIFHEISKSWSNQITGNITVDIQKFSFAPSEFESKILDGIKRANLRVVTVLAYESDTMTVGMTAYKRGMMEPGWAWIGSDGVGRRCTQHEETETWNDVAFLGWLFMVPAYSPTLSSLPEIEEFQQQVHISTQNFFNRSFSSRDDLECLKFDAYAASLFDSVYLLAHAATMVLAAGGRVTNGAMMVKAMHNASFEGRTFVKLDENGDGVVPYALVNYVHQHGKMEFVEIGLFAGQEELSFRRDAVQWPGNINKLDQLGS